MNHNFENLDVWKRGCRLAVNVCMASHGSKEVSREMKIEPFANTDAMIEETREISRMLSGFIGHLKPPSSLSLDS